MTTEPRPWLTRNLRIVSGVSFLQDAASELLYPIMPILLTTVLGAPAAVVGAVEGTAEGVAAVTKYFSGRLSDRYRKVPLVGLGYGLAALGKLLIALAGVWPVVLAGRCVDRLGKGIRGAPRDSLMVVDVPVEARGRAFGFHRAADTAGAVVGPLLALGALQLVDGIRPLLYIALVPAVLSVLLVFALKEVPGPVSTTPRAKVMRHPTEPLPAPFWRVVVVLGVFSLVNFPDALLLLRLSDIGFSLSGVILAYVGYNAVYAALSYPAGVVADRLGPRTVIGVGLLVFAVAYAGLGLTTSHLAAWLLLAGYGAFTGLTDGVGKAWVSSLLPAGQQGTGQGVFQGLLGAGVLVAGLWAGFSWGADGHLPLVVSGGLAAVMAVVVLAAPRHTLSP
ncbi:MAG: MFS transporter [Marmoricola sp.]